MYYDSLKRKVKAYKALQQASKDNRVNILELIAPAYYGLHRSLQNNEYEVYNLPGGRGSCKSSFVSLELVSGIMQHKDSNAVVFRHVGNTLRDSVFNQIQWAINELGVSALWSANVSPMQFTYKPTGQQIVLRGLDDPLKLKSIKPRKGYFKYLWIEELSEIPGENTVRSVRQSVLRGGHDYTVFYSFNPPLSRNNWANRFIEQPNKKAITHRTTYLDVPAEWLGESFIDEAERLKDINELAYRNEYLGEATGTGGEVFPSIEARTLTDEEIQQMQYIYVGLDWGFSVDPAVVMRVAYDSRTHTVYFLDEIYRKGLSNTELAELIQEKGFHKTVPQIYRGLGSPVIDDTQVIICDSAEPKSINDLQNMGLKAIGCKKYPGCVNYRIKWLQSKKIVIDPERTPHAYKEFTEYEYETTKDGELLSSVPDADNHTIDAVAYALDRVINKSKNPA